MTPRHRTTASHRSARDRASRRTKAQVVRKQPRAAKRSRTNRLRAATRRSDAERCCLRSIQVERWPSPGPGRHEVRRGGNELEPRVRDDGATARRWRAVEVFLHETSGPLKRVVTGMVAAHARPVPIGIPVAAVLSRCLGIAPRLAEQRGAGPSGEEQHDGQDGCAKHVQLPNSVEQERRQSDRPRICGQIRTLWAPFASNAWNLTAYCSSPRKIPHRLRAAMARRGGSAGSQSAARASFVQLRNPDEIAPGLFATPCARG